MEIPDGKVKLAYEYVGITLQFKLSPYILL